MRGTLRVYSRLTTLFAISIMVATMTLSAASVRGQDGQRGAKVGSQTTTLANPCRISEESPACLKSRIDRLAAAITNLEERLNRVQSTSQGSGDDKGDSWTNVWKEINEIKRRLKMD